MATETRKRVLITGGAQGIGKGIARYLLERGHAVVIADVDTQAGEETETEYRPLGDIAFVATDVTSEEAVSRCVQAAVDHCGRLDALINNAGIARPRNVTVEHLELGDWNRIIATNLTSCFLTVKYAAAHLRRTQGAIVNIASTRAVQSERDTEAYAASKGGIVALTHALAVSLGPEVRVNCVSPGWIEVSEWKKHGNQKQAELTFEDHAQHPAGRVGTPLDVAALVAFLISDEAGFITGQQIIADGGMTRRMIYSE